MPIFFNKRPYKTNSFIIQKLFKIHNASIGKLPTHSKFLIFKFIDLSTVF